MPDQLPISVLLLARDEAGRLERLLPELAFATEVVVDDDQSRDGTAAVAERHWARVHVRRLDGFGPQRRFALARCSQPWVLWIDADERLDGAALASLRRAVADDPAATGPVAGFRVGAPDLVPGPAHPLVRVARRARHAAVPARRRLVRRRPGARAARARTSRTATRPTGGFPAWSC